MEIPAELVALYTGKVEEKDGEYYIPAPDQQIDIGGIDTSDRYRIAIIDDNSSKPAGNGVDISGSDQQGNELSSESRSVNSELGDETPHHARANGNPPVEEGDEIQVEIESIGEQGDGIAKIEEGYVIVVENANLGDELTVHVNAVKQNYSFASIVQGNQTSTV